MATQNEYTQELDKFRQYLKSGSVENARRALLYPLFQKQFKDKFKIENDAAGADVYIVGQLIVESKTEFKQWLAGLFQALHYHRKHGLAFHTVMVVAREFVGIWKVNKLPEEAVKMSYKADLKKAPSDIGKELAAQCNKELIVQIHEAAFYWLEPKYLNGDIFGGAKNVLTESYAILKILKNLDSDRFQINIHNFIETIERMKSFFPTPIEAVHAFYTLVAYWDITSTVSVNEAETEVQVIGFKGKKHSSEIPIHRNKITEFTRFIETQYIFTNEGSGLTVDYYFSRFDEVLAAIDPAYVKQHGIFFTNNNLSRFALWFAKQLLTEDLNENYIVFDPAGGSGNLVSSWKGRLKHKIVSELQPDLLKIIERRMKADPWHVEHGFTIVPRTANNEGLNFLDMDAATYLQKLQTEVQRNNVSIDKPLAFLLNPPYKNTDENVEVREATKAEYGIHPSILELTGDDAGKERYLAFLGQILNISKVQAQQTNAAPIVMIFTPTSWLIPRPTYQKFRAIWDKHFVYEDGFIITSNEFFKLDGKWPLAFTIWKYQPNEKGNKNTVKIKDLTTWKAIDLNNINWEETDEALEKELKKLLKGKKNVKMDNSRGDIRKELPNIEKNEKYIQQPRYDYSTAKQEKDYKTLVSGFPLKDEERHFKLKRKCGSTLGDFIGFYDDLTPVRIKQDTCNRMSNEPGRIWFRLDNVFINVNQTKIFNGAPDKYGFCAYDLLSAKVTCSWFAITKALNGVYPVWANQYDIWQPKISKKYETTWYSLCFAFVLAENRCVVTKFEKDNPVKDAPEVFVDNPLCPTNKNSFWSTDLQSFINIANLASEDAAQLLIKSITDLYKYWNKEYCKGQTLENVGLKCEAYFKYFSYPDFVTPYSGLIQIKKYAEENGSIDLLNKFSDIQKLTSAVKKELYRLLVDEFDYFG